jgi:hypothetical protein
MTSAGESTTMPEQRKGKGIGKGKNRGADQSQFGPTGSPMNSPGAESSLSAPPELGKRGKGKRAEQFGGPSATAAPASGAEAPNNPPERRKGMQNAGSSAGGPANPPENFNESRGKQQPEGETLKTPPSTTETGAAKHEGRGRGPAQAASATPSP